MMINYYTLIHLNSNPYLGYYSHSISAIVNAGFLQMSVEFGNILRILNWIFYSVHVNQKSLPPVDWTRGIIWNSNNVLLVLEDSVGIGRKITTMVRIKQWKIFLFWLCLSINKLKKKLKTLKCVCEFFFSKMCVCIYMYSSTLWEYVRGGLFPTPPIMWSHKKKKSDKPSIICGVINMKINKLSITCGVIRKKKIDLSIIYWASNNRTNPMVTQKLQRK